jgi:hypothetical protein
VKIFLPPCVLPRTEFPLVVKKVYHPTRPPPGELRFLSETASLQEAGRALAIGPHPSILLPKQWRLFLFVLWITLVETNSFWLMKIVPQSSHSFLVDPSYPFSLNEPSSIEKHRRKTGRMTLWLVKNRAWLVRSVIKLESLQSIYVFSHPFFCHLICMSSSIGIERTWVQEIVWWGLG